jgi:uncharacterized protein YfiM (DUF2279 family)
LKNGGFSALQPIFAQFAWKDVYSGLGKESFEDAMIMKASCWLRYRVWWYDPAGKAAGRDLWVLIQGKFEQ